MFVVVESSAALPGCCRVCGSGDKEWFLDLGHSEDFYGAVYYCCDCITAIARACEFETPEKVELLHKQVETLQDALFLERVNSERLEKAVDALSAIRSVGGNPSSLHPSVYPGQDHLHFDGDSPDGETPVGSGEGEDAEPLHDERVVQLHPDDKSDGSGFSLNL